MFNLIPISLFIVSLGGLVYIVSNHLSELKEENEVDEFEFGIRAKFMNWLSQLPLDEMKSQSLFLTQKVLHRTRVLLLKADNKLMKIIGKIAERENGDKSGNGDGKKMPVADFWENISSGKPDEQIAEPVIEPEVKIDFAIENEAAKKFFDIKPVKKSARDKKSSK